MREREKGGKRSRPLCCRPTSLQSKQISLNSSKHCGNSFRWNVLVFVRPCLSVTGPIPAPVAYPVSVSSCPKPPCVSESADLGSSVPRWWFKITIACISVFRPLKYMWDEVMWSVHSAIQNPFPLSLLFLSFVCVCVCVLLICIFLNWKVCKNVLMWGSWNALLLIHRKCRVQELHRTIYACI